MAQFSIQKCNFVETETLQVNVISMTFFYEKIQNILFRQCQCFVLNVILIHFILTFIFCFNILLITEYKRQNDSIKTKYLVPKQKKKFTFPFMGNIKILSFRSCWNFFFSKCQNFLWNRNSDSKPAIVLSQEEFCLTGGKNRLKTCCSL